MSSGQLYDTIGGTYAVDAAHRAADRRAGLGCARRRADGAERRGRHRLLRAARPRRHRGGAVGGHARAAPRRRGAVRGRRRGEPPVRGPVLRRRDGLRHRPPLAGPDRRAARDAARGPPRGGVHARLQRSRLAASVLAHPRLPARGRRLPRRPAFAGRAGRAIGARVEPVLIPWDCADGFFEAYWRRPEAYLDEHVRRGMSVWTGSGRRPSSGRCAACATTSPRAGGPSATATSSTSTRPSSAFACSIG